MRTVLPLMLGMIGIFAGASACAAGADRLADWASDPRISDTAAITCVAEAELLRQLLKGARDFNAITSMATILEVSSIFASFTLVLDTRHGEGAQMAAIEAQFGDRQGAYLAHIKAASYADAVALAKTQVEGCKKLLSLR